MSRTTGPVAIPLETRARLLALAREALRAHLAGEPPPAVPDAEAARRRHGAFVTLREGPALRGCIGHVAADRPLGEVVRTVAVLAGTEDPRFPPVTLGELPHLALEISVLTAPQAAAPADVVVGRDGVVVRAPGHVGVLLPRVAAELGWASDELLAGACRKAGLPPGAWREPGIELQTFQAEVFGEGARAP